MFLPSDRDGIEKTLTADAEQRNGGKHDSAVDATRFRLRQADIIYSHMQDKDYRLPDLRLSSNEPHPRAPLSEQLKFPPRSVLSTFYQRLYDLNEYSRRIIIIPYRGMYILKRCCELIGEDYPSDNRSMSIAVQCAEQVKQILMLAGCSKMILQETVSYCYPIKSFVSLPGAKPWNC